MSPARDGISSGGRIGIIVILILLVLGAAYLAPSMLGARTSSTSSASVVSSSSPGADSQTVGLSSLFGYFSKMQVLNFMSDAQDQNDPILQQTSVSYLVLGMGSLNSTQYTKVQFSEEGSSNTVVAWFNPQGGIDRVDVLGDRNYTGSTAGTHAKTYVSVFSSIPAALNNATLFSLLKKTSESMTSIGPTEMDVTTYELAAPHPPFIGVTAKYATIPGTNQRLVVYLDVKTDNSVENTFQVTSLTK